jgi:osmoprotectant transport system permease protein
VTYLLGHPAEILRLAREHLAIVASGLALSVLIGVPLGILVDRVRGLELPVMMAAGLLYIVPSLALFAALIPFTGLGRGTAIVAQIVYSLLVIVRNTAAGLRSVSPAVREAALGMGLGRIQSLSMVEFPCALPVIVGGIRIAAVMGVGIASIAAYVGAGGLGTLVFRGIATVDGGLILAGAFPIALLALAIDFALRALESRLSLVIAL